MAGLAGLDGTGIGVTIRLRRIILAIGLAGSTLAATAPAMANSAAVDYFRNRADRSAERGIDRGDARRRHHEPRCRAAEETAHFTEAACTRHEHGLTDASRVGLRADLADTADGFIARDERISHARERRHLAGPEKPLGAGADAAPVDVDDDLFGRRVAQGQAPQRELPRPLHHHGERVQSVTHAGLPT